MNSVSWSVSNTELVSLRSFRHFLNVVFIYCLAVHFFVRIWTCRSSWWTFRCAKWDLSAGAWKALWGHPADHRNEDGCRTKGVDWRSKCQFWSSIASIVCCTSPWIPWQHWKIGSWDGKVCFASSLCGCQRLECEWPWRVQPTRSPQCLNTSLTEQLGQLGIHKELTFEYIWSILILKRPDKHHLRIHLDLSIDLLPIFTNHCQSPYMIIYDHIISHIISHMYLYIPWHLMGSIEVSCGVKFHQKSKPRSDNASLQTWASRI